MKQRLQTNPSFFGGFVSRDSTLSLCHLSANSPCSLVYSLEPSLYASAFRSMLHRRRVTYLLVFVLVSAISIKNSPLQHLSDPLGDTRCAEMIRE